MAEHLRDRLGDGVVLVGSEKDGKAQLVLAVSKPLTDRYSAGALIRPIAAVVGGTGGGRPDLAQAGGTDATKLDEAISFGVVLSVIRKLDASLSYITTGQNVPDDIEVGNGQRLAKLLLKMENLQEQSEPAMPSLSST